RRMKPAVFALLLAAGMPGVAGAATLAEAIDAALMITPGAQLTDARRAEGDAIERQASSLFADDLALTIDHFNDGIGSGDGAREWEAAIQAPIWLPGQRAARHAMAA